MLLYWTDKIAHPQNPTHKTSSLDAVVYLGGTAPWIAQYICIDLHANICCCPTSYAPASMLFREKIQLDSAHLQL